MITPLVLLLSTTLGLQAHAVPPTTDTLVVQTHFYCDHCGECGSCQPLLERELQYTKGVKHLAFDLKAHTITIGYDPRKSDPATLRSTIAALGFAADDVPYNAAGHQKLDACCQKP